MIRKLKTVGNSQMLILSKDVRDHMGLVGDDVELVLQEGGVFLRRPCQEVSFEDAVAHTLSRYRTALTNLAK
jgi:antitoxin component of MazEF toxin-antitoxin module